MRVSASALLLSAMLATFPTGMLACLSTPTDPNAGRALELPPSPDGGAAADGDAQRDSATDSGALESAPDTAPPTDSGGGA